MNSPKKIALFASSLLFAVVSVEAATDLDSRIQAAETVAAENALCTQIEPFYWEIGDKKAGIVSAAQGRNAPDANTNMEIASASKWIFGAYVVQKRNGNLSQVDIEALNMRTGYTSLKYSRCVRLLPSRKKSETVGECFDAGKNNQFNVENKGKFFYNGGHFQKYAAVDLNLKDKNNETLANEVIRELGIDFSFTFGSPQLAGGVNTSAAEYAKFLRAILSEKLIISRLLGADAVCTNPNFCPAAVSTPIPKDIQWNYSLAHWVENDPKTGDGSFSSAGAFGFYPWIDASKTYYGIVARKVTGKKSAIQSAQCGNLIRKAFITGAVN